MCNVVKWTPDAGQIVSGASDPYDHRRGCDQQGAWVIAQGDIPPSLLSFAHLWLEELGLGGKRCLLKEDGEALPRPFSGSMRLYREDGTCLELDTVAKPLDPEHPYVREVRAGNYDLIVISIASWCLREGADMPCPGCAPAEHTVLQHTVLHELVHVAFPEYSAHNEWTDNKVRELLERGPHSGP
jgi:hypothetical protein